MRTTSEKTFTGSLAEVRHQASEWLASYPDVILIDEGSPFAVGDQADLYHHAVWQRTIRYEEGATGSLFATMGQAAFGEHFVAPMANVLRIEKKTVMNMAAGKSRIPPRIWGEIAVLLHDFGKMRLDSLREAAIEASLESLARIYKVRNVEIRVEPAADGRWPRLKFSKTPFNQAGFWQYAAEGERYLPDDACSAVLEFDGEVGHPFIIGGGGPIFYPQNMPRA